MTALDITESGDVWWADAVTVPMQHVLDCRKAGCKHPAVYPWGTLGYCLLCRSIEAEREMTKP